jgi:hypothetical protein
VDDVLSVGVVERLGELAHEAHTFLEGELIGAGREEAVEALDGLIEAIHEGGPGLRLRVKTRAVEARMRKAADKFVLALRRSANGFVLLRRPLAIEAVDANPRYLVEGDMAGLEILVAGSLADELAQEVVGDLALASRGANTGFIEGAKNELKRRTVDSARLHLGKGPDDPFAPAALR